MDALMITHVIMNVSMEKMSVLIVAMHWCNYPAFEMRGIIESTVIIFSVDNDGFANVGRMNHPCNCMRNPDVTRLRAV